MTLAFDEVQNRARRLRLLLLDVDGVLTDGTVHILSTGGESKAFHIRDGAAIVWAGRQGLEIGLLSGRDSEATTRRAAELKLKIVSQAGPDKRQSYADIVTQGGYADEEVAYMGDDVLDLPILGRVGLSTAPSDAVDEVRESVDWVSAHAGGHGAVRELLELILRAQGKWDAVLQAFRRT